MPKPGKKAAPDTQAPPQVGDKVYPPRSELVYEISNDEDISQAESVWSRFYLLGAFKRPSITFASCQYFYHELKVIFTGRRLHNFAPPVGTAAIFSVGDGNRNEHQPPIPSGQS
jgi:hypothetical protein